MAGSELSAITKDATTDTISVAEGIYNSLTLDATNVVINSGVKVEFLNVKATNITIAGEVNSLNV